MNSLLKVAPVLLALAGGCKEAPAAKAETVPTWEVDNLTTALEEIGAVMESTREHLAQSAPGGRFECIASPAAIKCFEKRISLHNRGDRIRRTEVSIDANGNGDAFLYPPVGEDISLNVAGIARDECEIYAGVGNKHLASPMPSVCARLRRDFLAVLSEADKVLKDK